MRTRLREPSLRAVLTGGVAGLALVTLVVAAALVFISTQMFRVSARLHESTAAAHDLDRAAGALLLHARASDEVVRADLRADVLELLERRASMPEGADARRAVAAYFGQEPSEPRAADALTPAYGQVRELGERWVQRGAERAAELRRWDRLGDTMGITAAAVLLSAVVLLLWWLHVRALRPLSSLAAAVERFGTGDAEARADPSGPKELAAMGRRFNAMADALAHRREQQLSFLAGVAHDLRTPLSTLQFALSTAERRDADTKALGATLAVAARQVSRIDGMLSDLLEVVRSDHGMMRVKRDLVEVRRLCEGVVGLFAGEARRSNRVGGRDERCGISAAVRCRRTRSSFRPGCGRPPTCRSTRQKSRNVRSRNQLAP